MISVHKENDPCQAELVWFEASSISMGLKTFTAIVELSAKGKNNQMKEKLSIDTLIVSRVTLGRSFASLVVQRTISMPRNSFTDN